MTILIDGELIEVDAEEYKQTQIDKANGTYRDQEELKCQIQQN